ncbi:AMP-binding protein [Mesorhizobium sp. KR2-14]|uniref:AMP-binding protein n=1 Tax=Mesorhizobium sp. KR2-14 TaxID=3156610 RepID=UPI0032B57F66
MRQAEKFQRAARRWEEWQPRSYALADRFVPRILADSAREFPDRIAFRFEEGDVSFAALQDGAERIAGGLAALGLGEGMRLALMLPNSQAFLESWFGANLIGVTAVPINTAQRGEGLRHQIGHADCRAIVIDAAHLTQLSEIIERLPHLRHVIVLGEEPPPCGHAEALDYEALRSLSRGYLPYKGDHRGLATISYTSGTTGPSKGVMIGHGYWYEIWAAAVRFARLVDEDVHYCALPYFHLAAHGITGPVLLTGASAVVRRRFSATRFMEDCRENGCTTSKYVGSIIPFLMKQPESARDAENPLRLMIGSAAPKELFHAFEKRYDTRLLELYGMTECNACLVNPYENRRPGSCGKPTEGWDVRIVDDDDLELPPGAVGEIVARPLRPWLGTSGYDGNPEATLELMRNHWMHTGDLGYRDEDGYFHFVDRRKQAIRRRGENISSFEVEAAINSHEAVLESAVVGVPSPFGEEEVKAVVVLRKGERLAPDALLEWCRARLPRFAVPRYVAFRDALPKTPSQRVEKYRLKEEGITADCWDGEA